MNAEAFPRLLSHSEFWDVDRDIVQHTKTLTTTLRLRRIRVSLSLYESARGDERRRFWEWTEDAFGLRSWQMEAWRADDELIVASRRKRDENG